MVRPVILAGRKFHRYLVHLPLEAPAGTGWLSSAARIWCHACLASSTEPSSSMVVMSPGFFILGHRLENTPHDLAAARLRQHVHEVQLPYDRDRTQLVTHLVEQRLASAHPKE